MSKAKVFGYARVSTKEQNEARQIEALKSAGVDERDIFIDKQSGKNFIDRPQYQTLVSHLREGDTLIVLSIDRLGRDYTAIISEWEHITQEINANIKVLDMPLLDTTMSETNLDGKYISNLVLQILSYVAEKERSNIRERQHQGQILAKKRGVHMGRPAISFPNGFEDTYKQWKDEAITAKVAMETLGLKRTSFYKLVKQFEGKE